MDEELINWAIDKGLEWGADEIEIFSTYVDSFGIEVLLGMFPKTSKNIDSGAGIRVIKDKKIGFSYTTSFTKESFEKAIKEAISSASASVPLKDWVSLPEPDKYPEVRNLVDSKLVKLDPDEIMNITKRIISMLSEKDKRINPLSISSGAGYSKTIIANSRGVSVQNEKTLIYVGVGVMGVESSKRTPMIFEFDSSTLFDIKVDPLVETVAEETLLTLKEAKGRNEKATVIFHPFAFSQLLTYTLIEVLSGDYVKRGVSPYIDKIGETIASEILTLIDDGTLEKGLVSGKSDDEGIPMQRKILIEDGELKGFYFDNYTGKATGNASTGNGLRYEMHGFSTTPYANLPKPQPSNLIIKEGDEKLEEIISEVRNGYMLINLQGAHSSNTESGDFSVAAAPLWRIENGEIVGSLPGAMISGNMYQLLKHITHISKETKKIFHMVLPYIAIENVNVVVK